MILELSELEAQIIINGLGKLPAEQSIELILKVKDEYVKQSQSIVLPKKDEE